MSLEIDQYQHLLTAKIVVRRNEKNKILINVQDWTEGNENESWIFLDKEEVEILINELKQLKEQL